MIKTILFTMGAAVALAVPFLLVEASTHAEPFKTMSFVGVGVFVIICVLGGVFGYFASKE